MMAVSLVAVAAGLTAVAAGQFVTWPRANLSVVSLPGGASVSYKEPVGVCRTVFDSQRQLTGWVGVPGPRPANLFFWFVEAREPTDSLTVWLNGGPGASSMLGLFAENGPCEVVESGVGEYETLARQWGWDRASNMLFIDQPNLVGFSYDTPTNGTFSVLAGSASSPPSRPDDALPAWASPNGTFATDDARATANSTRAAAMAAWHTIQGFLAAFPQYQPRPNASVALSLFAQSYGGVYGPVFAETWEAQNQKRLTGVLDPAATLELRLTSLGILNGCVDGALQLPTLPAFANNNTYGVKALLDVEADLYRAKFFAKSGCRDSLARCEAAAATQPFDAAPGHHDVDQICRNASMACADIEQPYFNSGKSIYDIAAPAANPEPPLFFADYLNQPRVQAAMALPVNFTLTSGVVVDNFAETGDLSRGGNIQRLAALVRRGVRVGFVYGDRDYICNWFGGEAVSLAVAQQAGGQYAAKFAAAGYAPIVVNDSYIGGVVRQFGNLSFSRIYQAGHSVAWYQPETAFQVFARILLGRSVSMGNVVDLAAYNTTGPRNSTRTAKPPDPPKPTCFIRAFNQTCDEDAAKLARRGGVVINGVLYSKADDWVLATLRPDAPATATSTSSPSSPHAMTGLYTATATPSSASSALRPRLPASELLNALFVFRGLFGVL